MKSDGNKYGIAVLGMTERLKPKQLIVGSFIVIISLTHICLGRLEIDPTQH